MSGLRLLIIEDEYLIALGMQFVLEGADAAQTVVVRNFEEAAPLADGFGEFDLAIINPPRAGTGDMLIAERLVAAGPAIVVCTAARLDLSGGPLAGAEMLVKPYVDDDLLAACRRALPNRQPSLEAAGSDLG